MNKPDIYQRIRNLGIRLEYSHDLPEYRLGAYYEDVRIILCKPQLAPELEQEVLHHEYVHALRGDTCSPATTERAVWQRMADMIIDPAQYAAIERWTLDPVRIAHELGTTPTIVRAYQQGLVSGEIQPALLQAAG